MALQHTKQVLSTLADSSLFKSRGFIGNQWVGSISGRSFPVLNPSTLEEITSVPSMGLQETKDAIELAHNAFQDWKKTNSKVRYDTLRRWNDLIMQNQSDLAKIMTLECGKTFPEAKGEVAYAASFVQFFAEEARRVYGETIPSPWDNRRLLVLKQPVGVASLITPWNFPMAMITRKVAPAIAAGCTAVIKPAEETPLSALALCELALRAGFPAGVINTLTVSRENVAEVGKELATNSKVRKLSFTGSTSVGKLLMSQCAQGVKKVSLELGGNAPFIVFEDADIDEAVSSLIKSKFRNAGQTCICPNRILVHRSVAEQFKTKLVAKVSQMKVADGMESGADIGPLINLAGLQKVEYQVTDAIARGGQLLCGGKRHQLGNSFFEPTVISNVNPQMRVWSEETFGPAVFICEFSTEKEAIQLANDTTAGLAGYFFSKDLGKVFRVAEALEYGMVSVNEGQFSSEVTPFGGVKESGFGTEGSKYGIDEFLVKKLVSLAGIDK